MPLPCKRMMLPAMMLALVATTSAGIAGSPGDADIGGDPSRQSCLRRVNGNTDRLLACIRRPWLWNQLVEFQRIADDHPDSWGHGNRDTGTSGYRASVNYVARLMRGAGYRVSLQSYPYKASFIDGTPELEVAGQRYEWNRDWFVAHLSAGGRLTTEVQALAGTTGGCSATEFGGFTPGSIALLQRSQCSYDTQVGNAVEAGAAAVILYNRPDRAGMPQVEPIVDSPGPDDGRAFQARLARAAPIPVIGVVSSSLGMSLRRRALERPASFARLDIPVKLQAGTDFNLIAESPFGNPSNTVVVDAHLDSIFGAGILDNASGSATILEIALNLAHTPTRNRLRYVWFGGEELGLLGSKYYTAHLGTAELRKLVFDVDVDVTATPNHDYLVADPAQAPDVKRFPPNVVPDSQPGNQYFADYFSSINVPSQPAGFGNEGTDSNSFALVGIPDTGILTQQDCCKQIWEVAIWGGYPGDYEGRVPGYLGGCVDRPLRWCDNLDNNDPAVMETASKAAAYTVFRLANHPFTSTRR